VSAPAEGGRANDAVVDLLSATLAVPRAAVRLTAGAASRDKLVVLDGLTGADVDSRLAAAAEGRR
jgi:hypothetical protein